MQDFINFFLELAKDMGYIGIVFLMTLESCFIPFPSEVVMIPAGYLAHQGELNAYICILCGILGSVLGALINYYICFFWGRSFVIKYGKIFGITEDKFKKFEFFFNKHGEFSTFICRLLPGIRQYISLPAGLAKMKIFNFIFFTAAGSGIWVSVLVYIGYILGQNEELIKEYLHEVLIIIVLFSIFATVLYIYINKRLKKRD